MYLVHKFFGGLTCDRPEAITVESYLCFTSQCVRIRPELCRFKSPDEMKDRESLDEM